MQTFLDVRPTPRPRPARLAGVLAVLAALVLSFGAATSTGASAKPSGGSVNIIGGDPASPGEYPFMAAILNENIAGNDYQKQFCGGALIARDWVLTAGHCADGAEPEDLAVAVGRTVLSSNQGQRRDVVEVVMHPDYDSRFVDAALLRLSSPVTNLDPIRVAGLADDGFEAAGTPLTVIGWGNTRTHGQPSYPDDLREVTVPAVSDEQCAKVYGRSFDAPIMLCAGELGVDSCQGDSGGPLFATDAAGDPVHMGIVSFGQGCAKRRFPGVYAETNSDPIRSWIAAVT